MIASLTILYDGWPLVYEPNRPAALHLYALLSHLPPAIRAVLAMPGEIPHPLELPGSIQVETESLTDRPAARLTWEQRRLPGLARRTGAQLVHLTHAHPALFAAPNTVVSPTGPLSLAGPGAGLARRLREALSAGGMARARGVFWPEDLPQPDPQARYLALPPMVHPAFLPPEASPDPLPGSLSLPETFILYHGPYDPQTLNRLLSAWTWGAGALGELYPLVLLGASSADLGQVSQMAQAFQVQDALQTLPPIPLAEIPAIYRACAALFHPAPLEPWGGAVRHALACGKPVVALESPLADALVGPAAFLVPPEDTRSLGAALITAIVEPEIADRLAAAALARAAPWRAPAFGAALHEAYLEVLGESDT